MDQAIFDLTEYAVRQGLIAEEDRVWAVNRLLEVLKRDGYTAPASVRDTDPAVILDTLVAGAVADGVCEEGIGAHDRFDTALMGALLPPPHEIIRLFRERYEISPEAATDWYYRFAGDTHYIRRDRIAKDLKWVANTRFGDLDITVNLSKPEKDPKAIAAAGKAAAVGYPACQLCKENEGYAGRADHPARQNHRPVPVTLAGRRFYFQHSPYVYYNEHCIVYNADHVPMVIEKETFRKLLDFVAQFPHYFLGSNADLPIVGGSILSHDHFQGGRYTFPMEKAEVEQTVAFSAFRSVEAGIVRWPMATLRLRAADREDLIALADRILTVWRGYSDREADILAETGGEPHNTVTPIARFRDGKFELDLVLRNNRTSEEHPLGIFHPHAERHHIKKENIGLIEVMGLAVLPARLKAEMAALRETILAGADPAANETTAKHAAWVKEILARRTVNKNNIDRVLEEEIGAVFAEVLADAGVYKTDPAGRAAFLRFIDKVNESEAE